MAKISKAKQDEIIENEKKAWLDFFNGIAINKRNAAERLIDRVAFMKVTLDILEDEIKTKGPTVLWQNGSQKSRIENPAQKSYNTMINRYTAACDKLFNLLPENKAEDLKEQAKNQERPSASDLV